MVNKDEYNERQPVVPVTVSFRTNRPLITVRLFVTDVLSLS